MHFTQLDVKQSLLRRIMPSDLELASHRATLVAQIPALTAEPASERASGISRSLHGRLSDFQKYCLQREERDCAVRRRAALQL